MLGSTVWKPSKAQFSQKSAQEGEKHLLLSIFKSELTDDCINKPQSVIMFFFKSKRLGRSFHEKDYTILP